MQYNDIKRQIIDIIFQPHFEDVDDASKKIGDIIQLPAANIRLIKQDIKDKFGVFLNCDISGISTEELCKIIQKSMVHSEYKRQKLRQQKDVSSKSQRTVGVPVSETKMWNNRRVFGHVLSILNTVVETQLDNKICDLKKKLGSEREKEIDAVLTKLWKDLSLTTEMNFNPDTYVYNIACQITYDLVAQGRAISPEEECEGMDSFWKPIWYATSAGCLVARLKKDLEIWVPSEKQANKLFTKELEDKVSSFKSYEELEDFVVMERVKVKIDKIMFRYTTLSEDFTRRPNMSSFIISPIKSDSIKTEVQKDFNIKVNYDISGTRVNNLYTYVYEEIKNSQDQRKKLFDEIQIASENSEEKVHGSSKSKLLSRDEVFAITINKINSMLKNRSTSIQRWDKICYLFPNTEKSSNGMKNELNKWLRRNFYTAINLEDNNVNVYNVCSNAYKSLVKRGLAEDLRIPISEMHPLWGIINKSIPRFGHFKSVLERNCVRISVYNLSNCRTYWEYKQLVINSKILEATRPTISEILNAEPTNITLSASLGEKLHATSSDVIRLYNECEKTFGIRIPEIDRASNTIEDMVKAIIKNGQTSDYIQNVINGRFEQLKDKEK